VRAEEYFHSSSAGLYLLAAVTVFNAGLIAVTRTNPKRVEK
jgi:hypothetical protein